MADLDTRARAAAAGLRSSVDGLEPRPGATPPRPRRHLAVMAVVIAVLAGGIALSAAVNGDGDDVDVATGVEAVPRYVAGDVPDGFELTEAADLPLSVGQTGVVFDWSLRLYGRPGRPAQLGIARLERPLDSGAPDTVVGGGGLREVVTEVGGRTVSVASRVLDDAELRQIADGLDAEARPAPATLPEGFEVVAEQASASVPPFLYEDLTLVVPRTARGAALGYRRGPASITLSTHVGAPGHVEAVDWLYDAQRVGVAGHDARLGSSDGVQVLTWQDGDVVVTLVGVAVTDRDLLQVAESLRPLTDDEWRTLQDGVPGDTGEVSTTTVVARGQDGALHEGDVGDVHWAVRYENRSLCLATYDADGVAGDSCGSSTGGGEEGTDPFPFPPRIERIGDRAVVYGGFAGAIGEGPTEYRLVVDGEGVEHDAVPADPGVYVYAVLLPEGATDVQVVALDGAGTEIGRLAASGP